jgi:hypothetical protein
MANTKDQIDALITNRRKAITAATSMRCCS